MAAALPQYIACVFECMYYIWHGSPSNEPLILCLSCMYVKHMHLQSLSDTCRKLRYYIRYIPPGVTDVQLYGISQSTIHDPNPGFYT